MISNEGKTGQAQAMPQLLKNMDRPRLQRYQEHLDFYNGQQWPGRSRPRERRLTFNYARVLIDKITSYLMTSLDFAVDPRPSQGEGPQGVSPDQAQRIEAILYQVYEDNNLALLDLETEIDTAILGDGCYKVTWDPSQGEGRVRVTAPDVQGIYAWWIPDDTSQVWRVANRYQLSREDIAMLYPTFPPFTGGIQGGSAAKNVYVTEVWTAARFELWIDHDLQRATANPYGFIPFIIFPNLREPKQFWGVSDIAAIIEPAREINRSFSALSAILELSGNPIAVLENVDKAEDIAVQPGAVWEIPQDARAYLLDLLAGGGVRLHIDYIDHLYRTLHDLSESPRTAFGDTGRPLSGVALEIELHPLLQKIKRKRLIRTAVYRQRNAMILRLLEKYTGIDTKPYRSRIIWGPVLPQDRSRLIGDEDTLVRAGIHSRRRAMDDLGVEDPQRELNLILEEARLLAPLPDSGTPTAEAGPPGE